MNSKPQASEPKPYTLSKQYIAKSSDWFPLPRWVAEYLKVECGMASSFARFFIALWSISVGKYPKGASELETSQRELRAACGVSPNDISSFLAAMESCRVLTFTPASETKKTKSLIHLRTEKLFDDKYMRAFMFALAEVLEEIDGGPHVKNEDFATRVKRGLDSYLAEQTSGRQKKWPGPQQ